MYVKQLTCEHYGPINRLTLDFPIDEQGLPKLVTLVGQNGAGKSLVLSTILDAFIEIKRQAFTLMPEVPHNELLKVHKKDYIHRAEDYSYLSVEIAHGADTAKYSDVANRLSYSQFREKYAIDQYPHLSVSDQYFQDSGFHKHCTAPPGIINAAKQTVVLYFPYFRYENPAWLNPTASARLETRTDLLGHSESIIKTNIVREIEGWILDIIMDKELYEKKFLAGENTPAFPPGIGLLIGYEGPNTTTQNLLNELLTAIYKAKDGNVVRARIGISGKSGRKISTLVTRTDGTEETAAPTFSHLSSGEFMAFAIGATILREYDQVHRHPAQTLNDIEGVVMVDEVDLHLHIKLQKEVLPALIKKFPKIQFIVTTHSPFFLLGLDEDGNAPGPIYNLPQGNQIEAEKFIEFEAAYNSFVDRERQYKKSYDDVMARLREIARPLLITEGKTDWKHLKSALIRLRANGQYQNLDFEFLEYEDPDMGDSTLKAMCEQFARIPQARRVIFVFDRDNPTIITEMAGGENGFKNWGNNVFSFCIPIPPHRAAYRRISIEFYYSDDEIATNDLATHRRLLFSNQVVKSIEVSLTPGRPNIQKLALCNIAIAEDEHDKIIYDKDCDQIVDDLGNHVALSKSIFAAKIYAEEPPFNNFDVTPFSIIFERVSLVLEQP